MAATKSDERLNGHGHVTDTRRRLPVDTLGGMRKDLRVEAGRPVVAELMADVAEAVSRRATAVSKDVYKVRSEERRVGKECQ